MADLGGNPADFNLEVGDLSVSKKNFGLRGDGISKKIEVEEDFVLNRGSLLDLGLQQKEETRVFEGSVDMGGDRLSEDSGGLIEENPGKVGLVRNIGSDSSSRVRDVIKIIDDGLKADEIVNDEDENDNNNNNLKSESESEIESESESSSSSSSSSTSDEDSVTIGGDKKIKNEEGSIEEHADIEESEFVLSDTYNLVDWSDDEDAECGKTGPITSKNELKVLPPVPSVCVTLQPHHQTLPVGVILSIVGAQVIVEGVEKHNPLNEGSILWITQSRLPLGIIDEIFGPVKNPYYIVRYNSESEVPAGIQQDTSISFVQEFANHVLNDNSLYQKGYDASGDHDEELSDQLDFSDDEQEAEYRRMIKMKKRGTNESMPERKKKHCSGPRPDMATNQGSVSPFPHGAPGFAIGPGQDLVGNQAMGQSFWNGPQGPSSGPPSWSNNEFPRHQQLQSACFQSGPPANNMFWMPQNGPYQLFQTPVQTNMAFQQQPSMIPGMPFDYNALGGQPNFVGSPMFTPWATSPDQFGMSFQGQPRSVNGGGGEQAGQCQGPQNIPFSQQSPESLSFSRGRGGGGGGRRGHRSGRGCFGGGRSQ